MAPISSARREKKCILKEPRDETLSSLKRPQKVKNKKEHLD